MFLKYSKLIVYVLFLNSCYKFYKQVYISPQLQSFIVKGTREISFNFDTEVRLKNVVLIDSDIDFVIDKQNLIFERDLVPGKLYDIVVTAENNKGYQTKVQRKFYGYNPDRARLIFNEFTIRHSAVYKERIEFYVIKSGNLAGLVLFVGQPGQPETYHVIFPSKIVRKGELVVCLLRPVRNSSHNDYDIFLPIDPPGLPSHSGMLLLMDRLGEEKGQFLDAVVYVDYENLSKRPLSVFSKYQHQLKWFIEQGLWIGDPIESCKASSTRSFVCTAKDKDKIVVKSKKDWYITATSEAFSKKTTHPNPHWQQFCLISMEVLSS